MVWDMVGALITALVLGAILRIAPDTAPVADAEDTSKADPGAHSGQGAS